jgi:hypothetical protein
MGHVDAQVAVMDSGAACPPEFVVVPATTLPCGVTVPAFAVARWLAARGPGGRVLLSESARPWVNIGYHAAVEACRRSGMELLTELQALALAHHVARQAVNWSGGALNAGKLYQGLHKGEFRRPQPACVVSLDPLERRWLTLSTGERIADLAGNAFSWVFDDVQGNAEGVVVHAFAPDSPTVTGMPGAPMEAGLGWWPKAGSSWWGRALARGGMWSSRAGAGVFTVVDEKPRSERPYIGFRCTLPLA